MEVSSYAEFVSRHSIISSNDSEHTLVDEKAHEDALIEKIFSVVNLPEVQFENTTSEKSQIISKGQNNENEQEGDESAALAELDHILNGLNSTSISSLASDSEPNNGLQSDKFLPNFIEEANGFSQSNADQTIQVCTKNEEGDRVCTIYRMRSNTLDSLISVAESRYGSFEVHDPKNKEINLFHDEVAYARPRQQVKHSKAPLPVQNAFSNSENKNQQKRCSSSTKFLPRRNTTQQLLSKHEKLERETSLEMKKRVSALLETVTKTSGNSNKRISIYEEDVGFSVVLERQLDEATLLGRENGVNFLQPHFHEEWESRDAIQKVSIGGDQESTNDDTVILLFGPRGSGKTSIVSTMLNYLYDVKREHEFRLCMQMPSDLEPTENLTAYTFNNTIYPFKVTVVDTPGVPDENGYNRTSKLIRAWFQQELQGNGKFRLDAMGIVLTCDQGDLKAPFICELTNIQSLFGVDLKSNVLPLITSAEVLPQPLAIRSLVMAKVNFLEYYKIENTSFLPLRPGGNALKHSLLQKHTTFALERLFQDVEHLVHPILAVLRNSQH